MEKSEFIVSELLASSRLDKFLVESLEISRSKVQKILELGLVKVNHIVQKSGYIVKLNQSITIEKQTIDALYTEDGSKSSNDDMTLLPNVEIVYEDDSMLIINKPAGLNVHPGAGNRTNTLVDVLKRLYSGPLSDLQGPTRPGIVHRLDKDTSGLLVIAKNDLVHTKLSEQIAQRTLKRSYLALVWGVPKNQNYSLINPSPQDSMMLADLEQKYQGFKSIYTCLAPSNNERHKFQVTRNLGKSALTYYQLLEKLCNNRLSIVELKLHSGRTHQIRAHLSYIGNSVFGDQMYGNHAKKLDLYFNIRNMMQLLSKEAAAAAIANLPIADVASLKLNKEQESILNKIMLIKSLANFKRQALHAYSLELTHPLSQKPMLFKVDWPEDIKVVLNDLYLL